MEEGVLAIAAVVSEVLIGRVCYWTGYVLLQIVTLGKAEVSQPNPIRNRFSIESVEQRGVSALSARVIGFVFWLIVLAIFLAIW